jgi:hypothetical protein
MGNVVWDVSMSLDGFKIGPNVRAAELTGVGGERLSAWMFGEGSGTEIDAIDANASPMTAAPTIAFIGRRTTISQLLLKPASLVRYRAAT